MALDKYRFNPGDKLPAVNIDSIDPDNIKPQAAGYLTGGTGHSDLSVFQDVSRKIKQLLSDSTVNVGGTSGQQWVQSFTTESSGYVHRVYLSLQRSSYYSVGINSTLRIYLADSNDRPTGSALATVNKPQQDIPTSQGDVRFEVATQLLPNTKYCLVYDFKYGNGSYFITLHYQNSNVYSGGIMSIFNGTTWTSYPDRDFRFYIDSGSDNDGRFKATLDGVVRDNISVDMFKLDIGDSELATATNTGANLNGFFTTYTGNFRTQLSRIRVCYNSYTYPNRSFKIRVRQNNSSGQILAESETKSFNTNSIESFYDMGFSGINAIDMLPNAVYYFESVLVSGENDTGFRGSDDVRRFTLTGKRYIELESLSDVATAVQTAIRAATSSTETVEYDTDHFKITSATKNRKSQVLKLMTPSTGTDISGAGATPYLDMADNATETQGTGEEYRLVRIGSDNLLPVAILPKATIVASDTLQGFANTERTETGTAYTKKKEILIARTGVIRVKFDLKSSSSTICYGRVYKNGSAIGTERNQGPSYATYTEDISVVAGDLIQLYAKASAGQICYVKNFQICYTELINTVNTD